MKYPYPVINRNIYKYDDMKRGEHMAVRTTVGWYLWTHQLVEVTGADCVAFLEMIFPKRIGTLAVGRERYTTMLDEQGIIIDDVVVFRMGEQKFWISTLFKGQLMGWLEAHKGAFDVAWTDITGQWEMYAVQGPKSLEMVNALVAEPVDDQRFFEMRANKIDGIRCAVCSEPVSASLARQHNNANIVAMGARMIGPVMAEAIVDTFLTTDFLGGRHQLRIDMMAKLEKGETLE